MKLRNKGFIVLGLLTAGLCLLSLTRTATASIVLFSFCVVGLTLITALSLYKLIFQRLELLNQRLTEINQHNSFPQIPLIELNGQDEIADLANNINRLILDMNNDSRAHFKRELEKSMQAFEEKQNVAKQNINVPNLKPEKHVAVNFTNMVRYDNITSLPNRIFFNEVLNKSMSHAKRHHTLLAILLVNIDNFKSTQNYFSENQSELILKEIGRRFATVLRTEDILAKLEGDEFVALLNDISKSKFASAVAEKLLQVASHPMKIDNHEFSMTASIGICVYPNDGQSLEDIFDHANQALFQAKQQGGNRYQFYTQAMDVEAREYIQLESALKQAIHNNEIALYYQPKFSIKKGSITGVEALMRWNHPTLGVIPPSQFIPIAEETGLIMQLGEWALREACRMNKFWQDEGYEHLTIALNISAKQFLHPEISKIITNILNATGLKANYLELEITETSVMQDIEVAAEVLAAIKTTGVQISLDHFGTGYTAISSLKKFPINMIKIDQTFIRGIPTIPNDVAITSAMIALAHNLGFDVVAEGVETAEQVQCLSSQGCDIVQGYFLSHPVPGDKIILQFTKLRDEVLI